MMHLKKLAATVATIATLALGSLPLHASLFSIHLTSNYDNLDITGTVDTSTDTFTINTWTSGPGLSWTPAGSEFPITLSAYTLAGFGTSVAYDVADNWDGTMSGWGFMLPEGTGVGDMAWNEGTASLVASSFGWGGFRGANGYTADLGGIGAGTFQYMPMSNGAVSATLNMVEITGVPDAGGTAALLAAALGLLVVGRSRRVHQVSV